MSAYPTTPAFTQEGDYDAQSQSHPATAWIEQYNYAFDAGLASLQSEMPKWHINDFSFRKPDGSDHIGIEAGSQAIASIYGPLIKWRHQPRYFIANETADGWSIFGIADLFYILPGEGQAAGATDNRGEKYDGSLPGAFKFTLVKAADGLDGLKLARTEVMSDTGPLVVQLLQRGVLKPSDIGL